MTGDRWEEVDVALEGLVLPPDPVLDAIVGASARAGLPDHRVSALQGKMLTMLARIAVATTILEIGTLGGYSTVCLARALPPGGRLISLEADPHHAEIARESVGRAGFGANVEIRVGLALETLPALGAEGVGPFDLVFIDADKPNDPAYLRWAVALGRPGTVIIVDNVIRAGSIIDDAATDPSTVGSRAVLGDLGSHPAIDATAIQTVGVKGHDGFALAIVGHPTQPD